VRRTSYNQLVVEPNVRTRLRFGPYELDRQSGELMKDGVRLSIRGQPLELLAVLIERRGSTVTREELRGRLWPADTFVDFEHSLNTAVKRLRRALHDDPDSPKYVETLRGHGYRFIGSIQEPVAERGSSGDRVNTAGVSVPRNKRRIHKWTAAAAVVFVMATALVAVWSLARRTRSAAAPTDPRVMLAVLPFQNLSGAADQDYFSDGLTEETISNLGRLFPEDLGVIARTSAMTFKHTTKTVREIGRELGVDYILEGSVRRDGGTVRVSAQLIRVADQTHLWAHSYDRPLRDLLALEGELGQDIAGQVQLKLTRRQKATLKRTTSIDPRAYEAYLKARHFWFQFRLDSLNRSIDYYNEALQWDGKYAAAYAGLAAAYSVRANLYTPPTEDYPKAKAAADKALQLDEGLPNAHRAMAAIHIFYDWDWPAANRELTRLWELDPNPTTHLLEAYYLEAMAGPAKRSPCFKKFANWIRSHHSSETIWGGRTTICVALRTRSRSSGRLSRSIRASHWPTLASASPMNSTASSRLPPRSTRRRVTSLVLPVSTPEEATSLAPQRCGRSSSGRRGKSTSIHSRLRSSASASATKRRLPDG
jgi:TolB-like protein/DNA-binding winged helix-turn-helix (wHTH) protein